MNTLKFEVRFLNHNNLHNQNEFMVQCVSFDGSQQPNKQVFLIAGTKDEGKFNKISEPFSPYSDVDFVVASITDETGRKSFKEAFWQAIEDGFSYNRNDAGFNFEVIQSSQDISQFSTGDIAQAFTVYHKHLNGGIFRKVYGDDIRAAASHAKYEYFSTSVDGDTPTKLNVSKLWDEEDQVNRYYVEFDTAGNRYDATTWHSNDEVRPFFDGNAKTVNEACEALQQSVNRDYESEWEEVYTANGEFYNSRQDMQDRLKAINDLND